MEARGKVGTGPSAQQALAAEERADDFAYEGEPGRTRLEHVHVPLPSGMVRSVQVYRAVNVATDPQLAEPARSGGLHRFETGEELAIPFVYHDPEARKLALVIPEPLRHEEIAERARLLERIAADRAHPIPTYVRELETVIGLEGLAEYLDRPSTSAARDRASKLQEREALLDRRERALEQREETLHERERGGEERESTLAKRESEAKRARAEVDEREQRLRKRAETITSREDDLRALGERLDARERELEMRESELENRLEALKAREEELSARAEQPAAEPAAEPDEEDSAEEVEEVDELEEIAPSATSPELDLADAVQLVDDESEAEEAEAEAIEDDAVEELVDDGDVEEVDDLELVAEDTESGGRSGSGRELDDSKTMVRSFDSAPPPEGASSPPAPVTPPTEFLEDRFQQMAAALRDDGVWLFARLDEGHEGAFRPGDDDGRSADLLVQLADVQGYPVVLLALVEVGEGRPYARRLALDPERSEHRELLDALERRFEATVALFSPEGRYERSIEVAAPRGVNVDLILQRVARRAADAEVDAATALARALEVPPPIRASHPFDEDAGEAADAAEALGAVERLSNWAAPDKLDRAVLGLSVPRDVVDGTFRRVLDDALRHGIALPGPLVDRAVAIGVAPEPGELVTRQIAAFRQTARSTDRGGLDPEQVADNWEALLQTAADAEIAIDQDTHEIAWKDIREVKGESSVPEPLGDVDPDKLAEMGPNELVLLLEHPKVRVDAALELCRRGESELLAPLYKAVRKMPREEVAAVVPHVVALGEAAGDVLIDGLTARKTFVRQASAIGLGELKLRRAVVPLVHLLQNEPSDVWREVARVLGEFGTAAYRTVARQLKDPKGQEERLSYALACLASQGCEQQVAKLQKDQDGHVAAMAEQALTMGDVVKAHTQETRGAEGPRSEDPVRAFSARLYAEIAEVREKRA